MRTSDGSRRLGRLTALVLALAATAACFVGTTGGGDRAEPAPPDGAQQADPAEFERDIAAAVGVAEQYWRAQFTAAGAEFRPVGRVFAYRREGEVTCGQEEVPRNNAVYCPAGDYIAYDVNWAAAAFVKIGDAFLYYLLGHEYAHGIQVRFGGQYTYTIEQELQADCLAGAYIGDSVRAGRLQLEDGDLDEFRRGLLAVADDPGQPWFAPGAHGTVQQRTDAFFAGYQRSLGACNLRR